MVTKVLISNTSDLKADEIFGASISEVKKYQEYCRALTGSIECPPVLYKGEVIEAGPMGLRGRF